MHRRRDGALEIAVSTKAVLIQKAHVFSHESVFLVRDLSIL